MIRVGAARWLALAAVALPACIIKIEDGDDEPPRYPPVDARRPDAWVEYPDARVEYPDAWIEYPDAARVDAAPVDGPVRPDAGVDARPSPGSYDFVFLGVDGGYPAIRLGTRRGEAVTLRRVDWSAHTLSLSPRGDRVAYQTLQGLRILSLVDGSERIVGDGIADGPASWSPDGEQLVYASRGGTGIDLLRVTVDTGAYEAIAFDWTQFGDCIGPDWSPDGTEIAFGGDLGIRAYSLATGQVRTVAAGQLCRPRWSPSGAMIAFTHFVAPDSLDVVGRRGGPVRQLARLGSSFGGRQRWSPDGRSIAYVDYDQRLPRWLLRLARFDGTPPVLISDARSGTGDDAPAWSPGGDALLFVSFDQRPRLRLWDAASGVTTDLGLVGADQTSAIWFATPFVIQ